MTTLTITVGESLAEGLRDFANTMEALSKGKGRKVAPSFGLGFENMTQMGEAQNFIRGLCDVFKINPYNAVRTWWELRACDYYDKFEQPKIIYPDIAKESRITFVQDSLYFGNTAYFIPSSDHYLLGLLNSKLMFGYFKRNASVLGDADKGGRLRWFKQDVAKLPIRTIDLSEPAEKKQHDTLVQKVTAMLAHQKNLQTPGLDSTEKHSIEQDIAALDSQIDQLVYKLYDLDPAEIKIVEGTA